ncbi:MAG: hypothetical protein SF182_13850 [Deltaproteobacteria bacterium]|nr:hypothetical protein [Deltaproteobacteria bacterium]
MRAGLAAGLGLWALAACGHPAHDQGPCLPPVYDGGQRLHGLPGAKVFDLDLLLRQHELCWRRPAAAGERRVALLGSSAVFGFPLAAEQTLSADLNARLARDGVAAHVFNLAFVNPDQLRDAMILDAALPYHLDAIVYPLTLAEFSHIAPTRFPPLVNFYAANLDRMAQLSQAPPAGLAEPLQHYAGFIANQRAIRSPLAWVPDAAALLRAGLRDRGRRIGLALTGTAPPPDARSRGRQPAYDCAKTQRDTALRYGEGWATWNILAELERVQRERGIPVLIAYWPVAHEPQGDCYSVRYTNAQVREFGAWVQQESAARGLAYVDLHTLLPPDLFLDSLHVSPAGQQRIAAALAGPLETLLADRPAR